MTYLCPAGHNSEESDYCSVCGVLMSSPRKPAAPIAASSPSPSLKSPTASQTSGPTQQLAVCPSCTEPRADMAARYCEVCRFDFLKAINPAPAVSPQPAKVANSAAKPADPVPVAQANPNPVMAIPLVVSGPSAVSVSTWELHVTIDPSLDTEPDPSLVAPNDPLRVFTVELDEMLVGRRDDQHHIRPQIPIHDPGSSRRHAKFLRQPEGVAVVDLASTNGTKINGQEMISGAMCILKEGDCVTLGRWTRITLKKKS